ncbi:MAG: hypothetical protein HY541_05230 [Deltaproteobacteria bacterium]|nr:hypothetical protein [Deltaproteobacteria bacterium]
MLLSLFIFIFLLGFLFLVFYFFRDRKYLRKPTREALGTDLRKEIEEEQGDFKRRKERFEKALSKAQIKIQAKLTKRPADKPGPFA